MNALQVGATGVNELALAVHIVGHLLACLVAAAVADGAAGRWLRPVRTVVGGVTLALVVPAVAFGARSLDLLAPLVDVTGWSVLGTYGVLAGVLGVGMVVVASAAADAELTDPGYPSAAAALRAHLSGGDVAGVAVGTVALAFGELAAMTVANGL